MRSPNAEMVKFFIKGIEPEKPSLMFEDIEAEVSESEAHTRYAAAAVAFMVNQMKDSFHEATVQVLKSLSGLLIL